MIDFVRLLGRPGLINQLVRTFCFQLSRATFASLEEARFQLLRHSHGHATLTRRTSAANIGLATAAATTKQPARDHRGSFFRLASQRKDLSQAKLAGLIPGRRRRRQPALMASHGDAGRILRRNKVRKGPER